MPFRRFPRSYPDGMEDSDVDALADAPSDFIWDNTIAQGKSLRVDGVLRRDVGEGIVHLPKYEIVTPFPSHNLCAEAAKEWADPNRAVRSRRTIGRFATPTARLRFRLGQHHGSCDVSC